MGGRKRTFCNWKGMFKKIMGNPLTTHGGLGRTLWVGRELGPEHSHQQLSTSKASLWGQQKHNCHYGWRCGHTRCKWRNSLRKTQCSDSDCSMAPKEARPDCRAGKGKKEGLKLCFCERQACFIILCQTPDNCHFPCEALGFCVQLEGVFTMFSWGVCWESWKQAEESTPLQPRLVLKDILEVSVVPKTKPNPAGFVFLYSCRLQGCLSALGCGICHWGRRTGMCRSV